MGLVGVPMAQVSAKLDELLMDDCHVRCALRLLKELNDDLDLREKALQQSCSSRTRFLPTIGRPEELAAMEAARTERATANSAQATMIALHASIDAGLNVELENHVRAVSPAYMRGLAAVANLEAWPALTDKLAEKLTALLNAVGAARNMVSSGYDAVNRAFSTSANEAIDRARGAAHDLDEWIFVVNARADRHQMDVLNTPQAAAVLPRVPVVGFEVRIERVRMMGIADVQAEFNRILETCAMLSSMGLSGLREATERVAAAHAESSRAYLQTYLAQLRTYMDENRLDPNQTTERVRRLQQQHLGKVNFPYEMGT